MHELSIAQAIVNVADTEARRARAERVATVTVAVGDLSGVVPDSLEFVFGAAASGTLLEGATLRIERVPGRGWCGACEAEYEMRELLGPCPTCGAFAADIRGGQELLVRNIEVV